MSADAHIDPETIARLAEGTLRRADAAPLYRHVESCARCFSALDAASEAFVEETPAAAPRGPARWWLALAAAAAIVAAGLPFYLRSREPSLAGLAALAPRSQRFVEPRLSGGFDWAPYRGAERASGDGADRERMKLAGAAADAADAADRRRSADAQHVAGVAMVLAEQPLEAVQRLGRVTVAQAAEPSAWSDLAAARYAAALSLGRPSLYPEALAAADRALQLDPRHAEALFNRALILERMQLTSEARAAWQKYLAVDAASPWAVEARQRMGRLAGAAESFPRQLPRLEQAAADGDRAPIAELVTKFPQFTRTYGEVWHLGAWGEAVQRGDAAGAARMLTVARTLGDAIARHSGESLLHDAVAVIDGADATQRARLAEAQVLYFRGRKTYSQQRPTDAQADLRNAASAFAAGGSPMALVARYYAANVRYDLLDIAGARRDLEQLLAEADALPRYTALGAQVRWELALCDLAAADWDAALERLEAAEASFRRLGETNHLGFIHALLAATHSSRGRPDDAWAARIRSFAILSAEDVSDRLTASLCSTAHYEVRAERLEAARSMLRLASSAAERNDVLLADALVREILLETRLGNDAAESQGVQRAAAVADRIADPRLRARALADVELARGASLVRSDARSARAALESARPGNDGMIGTGVFDAGTALYEEAVTLALDRGDRAAAFGYAERTANLAALQRRLGESGAVLLRVVSLPEETIVFSVAADGVRVERKPVRRETLAALAGRSITETAPLRELYDLLIRPVDGRLAGARSLVVIPDRITAGIPFAALFDAQTSRYLIERLPGAIAPGAAALHRGKSAPAPRSIVAVALPAGEGAATAALPEIDAEVAEVAAVYPRSQTLHATGATFGAVVDAARGAEVLHIAGHTGRQPGSGETALLFADDERVSWNVIARASVRPAVVVLSACETPRAPPSRDVRALSLGGGFLSAGAANVIGTLAPVADREARELFRGIHRELAAGTPPAEAVRRTQRAAIARGDGAWRHIALLTATLE